MSHWRKEDHPGRVKISPEIKSNTLTEPSDKPLEDLQRMRGPWECEACSEMFTDSQTLLSHVRREHSGCHVSKLFVRHVESRRKYPLAMLFRHVITCGVSDCHVFAARNCSLDNALLDMKHHWESCHQSLGMQNFSCAEVSWHDDYQEKESFIKLIPLKKREKVKTTTSRRKRVRGSNPPKKKGPNFSEDEYEKGTQLLFLSWRAYKFVRTTYPSLRIPAPSSIRGRIQHFSCHWGLSDELFSLLKLKMSVMKEGDRNINLSFDEMDILPRTVYSERHKERLPRAKKAMCAMIRGLGKGFKELIYYDFDKPMTVELLRQLIVMVEGSGARVRSICMDMGNQKLQSALKVHELNMKFPHPSRPGEFIAIIPDVPHGLKNLRTNLFQHGVEFEYEGKTYSFEKKHFEELFEADQLGELRMCPKIK